METGLLLKWWPLFYVKIKKEKKNMLDNTFKLLVSVVGSGFLFNYVSITFDKIFGYNLKLRLWEHLFLTKNNDLFFLKPIFAFGGGVLPFCVCGGKVHDALLSTDNCKPLYKTCDECGLVYDSKNNGLKSNTGCSIYDVASGCSKKRVTIIGPLSGIQHHITYEYTDCKIEIDDSEFIFKTRKTKT